MNVGSKYVSNVEELGTLEHVNMKEQSHLKLGPVQTQMLLSVPFAQWLRRRQVGVTI